MKRTIEAADAPGPVGNFNLATTDGNLVFTAGQVPETADGDVLNDAPVEEQTRQCLRNLQQVLAADGLGLDSVLKTTVYVVDPDLWPRVNEAYGEFFETYPARTVVGVTGLWNDVDVEIEAVATIEQ